MTTETSPGRGFGLAELEALLAAHGADADAWPETARRPALALIEADAAARDLLDRAKRLDRLLAEPPAVAPSPELFARVLAAREDAREPLRAWTADVTRALWPFGPVWRPAAVLTVTALLGFGLVFTALQPPAPETARTVAEDVVVLAFVSDVGLEVPE